MPYENGLPKYANGTPSIVDMLDNEQLDTLHYINDYLSNLGMSTIDIAGIAANMLKESSFRHNAKDSAGYHGYVQMSPDMQLAVKAAYGNLDPDTQLQFVYDQLTGNSKVKGYTNGAGYQYGQYKTGGDAAEAFRSTFERNKAGRQQSRIDYGNQIYDYLTNRAVESAIKKEVGEQPMPITIRPDATTVKKIVPKAKTRARWTGADNISPYLTGKPIVKLQKKTNLPNIIEENKKAQWESPMGFKNGKLPGYGNGTPTKVGEYNVYPSAIGASELSVTTPEVVITGTDRRPMYQKYDAENSTYDPEAIRSFTDWAPVVGDIGQGLDAYNAFKNQDYLQAGVLGAMAFLPNAAEKIGKYAYRGLRAVGAPRWFAHDIVSNPKRVLKDWYNGNYAFSNKGVSDMLLRDNQNLNNLAEEIKKNIISDELKQRVKRVSFAKKKGILTDLMTNVPKDINIKYKYDVSMNPKKQLGISTDPINIAYYEHPISSRFKYKWDHYNGHELPITVGHEFVHRLEPDYMFSPHFKTSSSDVGQTGYHVPAEGLELITGGSFHMPSARSLMDIKEVQDAFSPTISLYNENLNRLAEAKKLGLDKPDFASHVWFSSPAEVVADLKGAIAAGMDEQDVYKFMYNKHGYDGDKIRELRLLGFKNGKSPIHINPANRGKFNATKKRTGKTTEELAHSKNPLTRKRAIFALNSRKWKH